ncbi:hypothetical protein HHK36_016256 [Tetracentron sinense]|uniref:non-specific serine/threonine protein kinase n=1 Tax=Tetracentron sinense TaxID=13715 RepID=A0A834Z364_TETSI|nr:hypothetical protein HHK36_016256 [Tetracentron sinense]
MQKTPSSQVVRLTQRKQNSYPQRGHIKSNANLSPIYSACSNKSHQNKEPALNYIKTAVKKVAGLFTTFLFRRRRKATKGDAPDSSQSHSQVKDTSFSTEVSTGSYNKSSKKFKYSGSHGSSSSAIAQVGTTKFSIEEIYKATDKFSTDNRIGDGGFGTVYKGQLRDGSIVAIKRAKKNISDKRLSTEFKNEILTLSKIEHLNLVRFLGYVEHGDERIIVVEYVGNGTLREHLDGSQGDGLELAERLDIAIDVAHAVTYLHMYTDHPIIHRDIKASNILITDKLRAKVADFGFARLGAEDPRATHISTQIKGTAGYLDPEYLRTYQLTEKSDVYSFGVLLVELMTGRHPIELRRDVKERVTIKWAMQKLKEGDAVLAMDSRLRRSPAANLAVEKIFELALQCLASSRQLRPNMKKCAEVLWEIRRDYRDIGFSSSSSSSTSHRSANLLKREAEAKNFSMKS